MATTNSHCIIYFGFLFRIWTYSMGSYGRDILQRSTLSFCILLTKPIHQLPIIKYLTNLNIFQCKPYGTSLATAANWILVFAVTFLTFVATDSIGFLGLFWMYSLFCALGALFVWYMVPETKNKSLNEIQLKLTGNNNSPASNNDV